jgi:hypothetical protein
MPRHSLKLFHIIIDTNSFIFLSNVKIQIGGQDKSLLRILRQCATIQYAEAVDKEIKSISKRTKTEIVSVSNAPKYSQGLFDKDITSIITDCGEKHNFILAMHTFLEKRQGNVVFLTDDTKAKEKENILKNQIDTYSTFLHIWSSFDVVTYLYQMGVLQELVTTNAIQTLINNQSDSEIQTPKNKKEANQIDNDEYSRQVQKIRDKWNQHKTKYTSKIETIKKLKSALQP